MNERDIIYLKHIRDSIIKILDFTGDLDFKEFSTNYLVQSGVIREIEIIGEAAKNISFETKNKYKETEWRKIAAMRDVLIHEYFRVDINEVYKTIKKDIPDLKLKIETILKIADNKCQ